MVANLARKCVIGLTAIFPRGRREMTNCPNPHRTLGAAILAKAAPAQARFTASSTVPWASVTFSGARHLFTLELRGPQGPSLARYIARTIQCDEFNIDGHLVADIIANPPKIGDDVTTLEIEALTVETR
jgi:hypothetical protein